MKTIKDLKQAIEDLPDETILFTKDDAGFPHPLQEISTQNYLVGLIDSVAQKVLVLK